MSWGKEWPEPNPNLWHIGSNTKEVLIGKVEWPKPTDMFDVAEEQLNVILGVDIGSKDGDLTATVVGKAVDGKLYIEKVYQNKVPTHDPYTNPDAHIYYQCNCGAVLDPGTKSFAQLNNAAMVSGWKIRWGHEHYVPYCVKCGEGVE